MICVLFSCGLHFGSFSKTAELYSFPSALHLYALGMGNVMCYVSSSLTSVIFSAFLFQSMIGWASS